MLAKAILWFPLYPTADAGGFNGAIYNFSLYHIKMDSIQSVYFLLHLLNIMKKELEIIHKISILSPNISV